MRIPLSWLRDFVDVELDADALAETVTNAGLEVTRVHRLGVAGADLEWHPDRVVLARIVRVDPHPDADKLVLATVDDGGSKPRVVVTGAPNLRPFLDRGDLEEPLYSPLVKEGGTYLDPYKDGKPTRLKGKSLRGVFNDAMLCSCAELGLGSEADGILILRPQDVAPESGVELSAGLPLVDLLGDEILEIDIIPNVARCASVLGVAREVAALTGSSLRLPSFEAVCEGEPWTESIEITTEQPELNPRFVAMLVRGVERRPSPYWLQHRLRNAGQRPIDLIVDISNYVMLEMGQPNHSFDYDFLAERATRYDDQGTLRLITRLAREGEKLLTLDGEERELHANNMLVTDPEGPLSLAGVMGGLESEIGDSTRNVLVEAAAWNFINIRHTSRQHGLLSEAAFRFSRGVHPDLAPLGARRTAELLRTLAGGTIASDAVDFHPAPVEPVVVSLHPQRVRELSGLDLEADEIAELLRRLEFEVVPKDDALEVTTPNHRLDIEGPHDLVEEVCRMYGYDRIPSTVLRDTLPRQRGNPSLEREQHIQDLLVQLGLREILTYRLTTEASEEKIRVEPEAESRRIRVINPSTQDRVVMRHHLLASALEIAGANSRFTSALRLFEIGHTYHRRDDGLADTPTKLAIVLAGPRHPANWEAGSEASVDFYDLKGVLDALAGSLHVTWTWTPTEHPTLRPGHSAVLTLADGTVAGFAGELHPLVTEAYDIRLDDGAVFAAEIDIEALSAQIPDLWSVDEIPQYPAIREDLAIVAAASLPASEIEETIRSAAGPLLAGLELFDIYEGEGIAAGERSLAYHLVFQSNRKTLSDKDAQKTRKKVVGALEKIGARLR